jgi:hypothetical protein
LVSWRISKLNVGQVGEDPGCRRRTQTGDGAGIDQPGQAALDVGLLPDFGFVAVAAADQVVVAGAGHAVADVRIVGEEDAPAAQLQGRILAVIVQLVVGIVRDAGDRNRVAEVVAVHGMDRQPQLERGTQGVAADDVAAVDHGFGALGHGSGERRRPSSVRGRGCRRGCRFSRRRAGLEAEELIEAHLADQGIGGGLTVFTNHVGQDQARAVAVVAAAEADLGLQQLARLFQCHMMTGPW